MFSNGDHKEDLQNKETDEFEEDNALEDDSNNFALDGEVNDGAVSQEKSKQNYFKLYLELVIF